MCKNPSRRLRARGPNSGVRCGLHRRMRSSPAARPPRQLGAMTQAAAQRQAASPHPSSSGYRDRASPMPCHCLGWQHHGECHQRHHGADAHDAPHDARDSEHFRAGNMAPWPPKRLGTAAAPTGKWRSIDAWYSVYRQLPRPGTWPYGCFLLTSPTVAASDF
jgi:hypothetical protein